MKRTITISIVLSGLMVVSASIMAVSSSATGSASASGVAAMPSATPKKVKKPGKPATNLSGGDDPQEVTGAARTQDTSGSANRTTAPSTKPAKSGKSQKATTNLSGGDDPEEATPAARNQSTSGGTGRSVAPNKKPGKNTKIIWDPTQEGLKSGAKGNQNSAPSATGTNSPGSPSGTTQKKPKP